MRVLELSKSNILLILHWFHSFFCGMRLLSFRRSASEASISVKSNNDHAHGTLCTVRFRKQRLSPEAPGATDLKLKALYVFGSGDTNEIHVHGESDAKISFQIRSMLRWYFRFTSSTFSIDVRALEVPTLRDFFDFVLGFFCLFWCEAAVFR